MNNKILIAIACVIIIAVAYYYYYNKDESMTNMSGNYIILYYAPWCGACKAFKPTWNEFKKQASNQVKVVEINCEAKKAICQRDNIVGYPTVRLVTASGKIIEYMGSRTVGDLNEFVSQNI